jgi:hypothetical protein
MSAATVCCLLHGGPANGAELAYEDPPSLITVDVRGRLGMRQARYQRAGGTRELTHYECVDPDC